MNLRITSPSLIGIDIPQKKLIWSNIMVEKKRSSDKRSIKTTEPDIDFWLSTNRLLGLSDGVIAIAITILAIKLIPLLHESHGSLWAIRLELYQYAIGFLGLGMYWVVHHHIFHIIKRADGILVWLNIVFLALASLGPFWTAFITKNPDFVEPIGFMGLSSCLTFMILIFILLYATRGHRLISEDLDERVPWGFSIIIVIGVVILAFGTTVGLFYHGIFGLFSIASAVWFVYMTSRGYKWYFSNLKVNKKPVRDEELHIEAKTDHGSFWMSPERISVLTDGVVAIALTLMVLELHIPNLKEHPNGLWEMSGEFFLIGVGFLALGLYWAIHNLLFHYIKRADGGLMWLNVLFLSFASLVPFWVAYINFNEGSDEAMSYYGIALTLTLLILLFIWYYATSDKHLVPNVVGKNIINGFTKFLVFILIVTTIVFIFNIIIPWFKFVSWIFSSVFFVYMTGSGYKRFITPKRTV
jgi:uncharacterized membrane protein